MPRSGEHSGVNFRRCFLPKRGQYSKLINTGVKRFGFHGIRHLTASLLAERNIPLVEIQHHLRHDHLSTTEKYIHQLQKNRLAIDALPGLQDAAEKCGPYEARKKETAR